MTINLIVKIGELVKTVIIASLNLLIYFHSNEIFNFDSSFAHDHQRRH